MLLKAATSFRTLRNLRTYVCLTYSSREALYSTGLLETKRGSRRARATERGSRNASRDNNKLAQGEKGSSRGGYISSNLSKQSRPVKTINKSIYYSTRELTKKLSKKDSAKERKVKGKDNFIKAVDDAKVAIGAAKYAPKHNASKDKDSKAPKNSRTIRYKAIDKAPKNSRTIRYEAASNEADKDLPLSTKHALFL
ncbi:hypothetical protein BCR34DRAFT_592464 [Clohesyomyces aquaticus]|uniref:Uncharacterized protein n=1 Tax=Clohesyomyces aquaticus TaxID=1231657 RepID=A0A1Y1YRZ3_9PLEO|nr:hypothetical protein BCR34DRAFT_592464 [Clohesyomyces aquaticus]